MLETAERALEESVFMMRLGWQWCCVGAAASLWACGGDEGTAADTLTDTGAETSADVPSDTGAETTDTGANETRDGSETVEVLAVVINELAPAGAPDDWIELFNAGANTVDLSGWTLRDDDPTHSYVFPAGTLLPAGVYLAIGRGPDGFDFGLGGSDGFLLAKPDQTIVDQTAWTSVDLPEGANWGRYPNGSGAFKTLWNPTRGAANQDNAPQNCGNGAIEPPELCDAPAFGGLKCERWGWGGGALACVDACTRIDQAGCTARAAGLVINEVTSANDDAIELFNGTGARIELEGYSLSDEAGAIYTFPKSFVDAGAYVVLRKPAAHTFGLGGDDALELRAPNGTIVDQADWAATEADVSYCRIPNGFGGFRACAAATFEAPND